MKPLKEALQLEPDGIIEEVHERRRMIGQMVGWLYPSIMRDEIESLLKEYERKKYGRKEA